MIGWQLWCRADGYSIARTECGKNSKNRTHRQEPITCEAVTVIGSTVEYTEKHHLFSLPSIALTIPIHVHFSLANSETMQDKIMRMLRNEASQMRSLFCFGKLRKEFCDLCVFFCNHTLPSFSFSLCCFSPSVTQRRSLVMPSPRAQTL